MDETFEKVAAWCKPTMEHPLAIVLGSGLGSLGERVRVVRHIPYSDIDGFPTEAIPVEGHSFTVLVGELDGVPVVVYPGRVHMYQGYDALQVSSLVRHAHKLGCRSIVLSCATGAVGDIEPGTVGIITDQLNLTGRNPLASPLGVAAAGLDSPFVSMAGAYSPYLSGLAREAASELGMELAEGVYAGLFGPSYETPAEIRMLDTLGADYVGMSTVCEAIMARAMGMEVLGITLVTNKAGCPGESHAKVLGAADAAAEAMQALALATIRRIGA